MSSPACSFRNRLIALSICLCALLAFSTTLSADTYQFLPGQGPYYNNVAAPNYTPTNGVSRPVGPYAGTLTDTSVTPNTVSPNSIFFCLTGNQSYDNTEIGTVASPTTSTLATMQQLEEAAFLASLVLTDAVQDSVTLSTTGTGNSKKVILSGTATNVNTLEGQLGPLQTAIWLIMGTLPSGDSGINDSSVNALVTLAQNNYMHYSYNNVQVFSYVPSMNTGQPYGQSFISVNTLSSVPEPGTLVLFGTGGLLMALGCGRKLLKRLRG